MRPMQEWYQEFIIYFGLLCAVVRLIEKKYDK